MNEKCNSCKGSNYIDSFEACDRCAGACYDPRTHSPCTACKGAGRREVRIPCPVCNADGAKPDRRIMIK